MRETTTLEFKQQLSKSYLKTVSAYANYGTGKIIFGIADDGTPVGLAASARHLPSHRTRD